MLETLFPFFFSSVSYLLLAWMSSLLCVFSIILSRITRHLVHVQFLVLASVLGSFALYSTHAQYGGSEPLPILGQSGGSPGGAGATPWYICVHEDPAVASPTYRDCFFLLSFKQLQSSDSVLFSRFTVSFERVHPMQWKCYMPSVKVLPDDIS